ncbi:MAG: aldehyde dehydrogenase family protein [Acidobacteriota bacterium]
MLNNNYPLYLGGNPVQTGRKLPVFDKYSGEKVTEVAMGDKRMIMDAVGLASEARRSMAEFPSYKRRDVLEHCVRRFSEMKEELANVLCIEAGKPIKDSRGEVARLIDTFRIAADESVRIGGEIIPMDISERGKGIRGMWKRFPVGVVSLISPFNFPLNLVAHKIAPAIASGCPFVLKPASLTPVGALIIGKILAETDIPKGSFSILPVPRSEADSFIEDERINLLSFTGSPSAGWELKSKAGKKRVVLELGGNAACVVDNDSDLDDASDRIVTGAFYQSGQSCVSVQRIMVHDDVYDQFRDILIEKTVKLKSGDPKEEDVFIGPMISEGAAERLSEWIEDATSSGGRLLCGGERNGAVHEATLLENVSKNTDIWRKEAFGPVAVLSRFNDFDAVLEDINDSSYGLQAGLFIKDIYKINKAWDKLDVGGVIIGDVPSWRIDHMPYGGVKDSGIGREGIKYAIEDMTEIKMLVIR